MIGLIDKEFGMRKLFAIAVLAMACSPVLGLQIYHLQGNQYAIICEDGTGYSFSGSATGAQEAGGLLCKEHGGVANIHNTTSANKALKALEAISSGNGAPTSEAASPDKGVSTSKGTQLQ